VDDLRVSGLLQAPLAGSAPWPGVGDLVVGPSPDAANALDLRWAYTAPGAYFAADTRFNDSACLAFRGATAGDGSAAIATVALRWPVSAAGSVSAAPIPYAWSAATRGYSSFTVCVTASVDCDVVVNTASLYPGAPPITEPGESVGAANWTRLHVLGGEPICWPVL